MALKTVDSIDLEKIDFDEIKVYTIVDRSKYFALRIGRGVTCSSVNMTARSLTIS